MGRVRVRVRVINVIKYVICVIPCTVNVRCYVDVTHVLPYVQCTVFVAIIP